MQSDSVFDNVNQLSDSMEAQETLRPSRSVPEPHGSRPYLLRYQLVIRQPLAWDCCAKEFEPLCVRHVLPIVVAEHLPEQMERLNADVGALQCL